MVGIKVCGARRFNFCAPQNAELFNKSVEKRVEKEAASGVTARTVSELYCLHKRSAGSEQHENIFVRSVRQRTQRS